ncbi:hypothetical protein NL676_035301 [Syzygium grande]|nr:hypothetical protein NL676_035301 [Syzygium grande]
MMQQSPEGSRMLGSIGFTILNNHGVVGAPVVDRHVVHWLVQEMGISYYADVRIFDWSYVRMLYLATDAMESQKRVKSEMFGYLFMSTLDSESTIWNRRKESVTNCCKGSQEKLIDCGMGCPPLKRHLSPCCCRTNGSMGSTVRKPEQTKARVQYTAGAILADGHLPLWFPLHNGSCLGLHDLNILQKTLAIACTSR